MASATLSLDEETGHLTPHGAGHSLSLQKVSGSILRRLQMYSDDACCSHGALKNPCSFSTANLNSPREDGFASALIQRGHISFHSCSVSSGQSSSHGSVLWSFFLTCVGSIGQ